MGDEDDRQRRVFPIRLQRPGVRGADAAAAGEAQTEGTLADACSSGESFALMVLGDSMLPEFAQGEIIVIEPDGLATDGSFVLAWWEGEWIFRQLARDGSQWRLRALDPAWRDIPIPDLKPVRGVIIQKSKPGRRRASKRYVA